MEEISQQINEDTIDIFVPIQIKKRGGTAMVICPKNTPTDEQKSYFDDKLIKMIGKAHKWKNLMEEGKFGNALLIVSIAHFLKVANWVF